MLKQSITQYLPIFCSFMRNTLKIYGNYKILTQFHSIKTRESYKRKEIYLTENELDALYNMKLDAKLSIIRDIFLVGCCTCQRFSDYSRVNRSLFTTSKTGTPVINLEQNVIMPR